MMAASGLGAGLLLMFTGTAGAQASPDSVSRVVLAGVTVFDGTGRPASAKQSVLIEGEGGSIVVDTTELSQHETTRLLLACISKRARGEARA